MILFVCVCVFKLLAFIQAPRGQLVTSKSRKNRNCYLIKHQENFQASGQVTPLPFLIQNHIPIANWNHFCFQSDANLLAMVQMLTVVMGLQKECLQSRKLEGKREINQEVNRIWQSSPDQRDYIKQFIQFSLPSLILLLLTYQILATSQVLRVHMFNM